MKGILEFTSLNARQKEIEIETTIQNQEVKGTFIIKFPSLMDKINIEARLTSLLAGADVNIMKTRIYTLAEAVCYLKEVIIKKPTWFDYANIDNEQLIFNLYEEARNFENSFRKEDGGDEPQGDSGQSNDEEPLEG